MGGQACILYGAAEFSRDVDVAVAIDRRNLGRLRAALRDLAAEPVYFPRLTAAALRRGHACQFRCNAPGCDGIRLDVMSVLRGARGFARLWQDRVAHRLPDGAVVAVMALPDLVRVKKTQRDKDWPMVRRLVESDIASAPARPSAARVRFSPSGTEFGDSEIGPPARPDGRASNSSIEPSDPELRISGLRPSTSRSRERSEGLGERPVQ